MEWFLSQQTRFDTLRVGELAGALTAPEQAELERLRGVLEAAEYRTLAPALTRWRAEQTVLREQLLQAQSENEALAQLVNQQEQLATEAREWLLQFERRHEALLHAYTRLTGDIVSAA